MESLEDFANPVITGSIADQAAWDPVRRTWNRAGLVMRVPRRVQNGCARGHQLAMAMWRCTVAGSASMASMQAARSARETVNPWGRLRSIAVR